VDYLWYDTKVLIVSQVLHDSGLKSRCLFWCLSLSCGLGETSPLRLCIFLPLHSKSSVLKHDKIYGQGEGCCSKQEWVLWDRQILSTAERNSEGSGASRGRQRKPRNGPCFKAKRLWCESLQAKRTKQGFKT